jgi:uncharacterized membrane protein
MTTTLRTGRLEAFSDGVFAIAITLLVLEISVPSETGDGLLDAFLDQWPSYLAYLVSFATIGAAWLAHTAITHYLHGADGILVRLNLLLLLLVSFLPFPTRLVADHIRDHEAERVATTILGSICCSLRWWCLRCVALRSGVDSSDPMPTTSRSARSPSD